MADSVEVQKVPEAQPDVEQTVPAGVQPAAKHVQQTAQPAMDLALTDIDFALPE
eukprot:m.260420 g.260420  ORF g.260420 m.260420 type:complete len:54 (-) comp54605_c0_seq4:167-328(-)